jgi:membrane glycosyltransferase
MYTVLYEVNIIETCDLGERLLSFAPFIVRYHQSSLSALLFSTSTALVVKLRSVSSQHHRKQFFPSFRQFEVENNLHSFSSIDVLLFAYINKSITTP